MRSTRDIRTAADPQDFESLTERRALPPLDFKVTKDAGDTLCIFKFKDFSGIAERTPTIEYRAYFVALTFCTVSDVASAANRLAAVRVGRKCCAVSTSGKGEWITVSSPDFANAKGWFMAVGVNRRGVESEPTIAFPSPYGVTP